MKICIPFIFIVRNRFDSNYTIRIGADDDEDILGEPFTFEDAFSEEFKPASIVGSWLFGRVEGCLCSLLLLKLHIAG